MYIHICVDTPPPHRPHIQRHPIPILLPTPISPSKYSVQPNLGGNTKDQRLNSHVGSSQAADHCSPVEGGGAK